MMCEYYVVFMNSSAIHQRFVKDGFGHCFVYYYTLKDEIILMEYTGRRFRTGVVDAVALAQHTRKGITLKVTIEQKLDNSEILFGRFGYLNCAIMIKLLLDVKALCFTPYQLYKAIKKELEWVEILG